MESKSINSFEEAVINKLLSGNDSVLSELRSQFENAVVKDREITGSGFYLMFALPKDTIRLTSKFPTVKSNFCFGDVKAIIENFNGEISFLIWVKEGILHMLEGYSYNNGFPENFEKTQLQYFVEPRNIQDLQKEWLITPS
jgi:hypothetical protein